MSEQSSPWRGRRILITGCTGFLGSAVAQELFARGAEVVGLVHERPAHDVFGEAGGGRVHLVRGRADNVFRLHSAMAVHEVAAVFHLATASPFEEDRATPALLQAVKLYSRRVPVVTARPLSPLSLTRTEELREDRLTVARFGELFGPGDRKLSRVVPATALALHSGDAVTPAEAPARDFVFVRDAARACLFAAEHAAAAGPGDHSFRSGWVMTDRQMASALRDAFAGRTVEAPDTAPPANPFDWKPVQTLREALSDTLAWYQAFAQAGRAEGIRAAA